MGNKFRNILLVGLGIVVGVVASIQFSAMAQKQTAPLPLDELRQLADVFGLIKSDYVEPVEDKKLLTEAISGMVSSLDPHSAYLDKKAFQELKEGTQGRFGGLGIEVGMEDGYVKVIATGYDENGKIVGEYYPTGNVPAFVEKLRQKGDLRLDMSVFVPRV